MMELEEYLPNDIRDDREKASNPHLPLLSPFSSSPVFISHFIVPLYSLIFSSSPPLDIQLLLCLSLLCPGFPYCVMGEIVWKNILRIFLCKYE